MYAICKKYFIYIDDIIIRECNVHNNSKKYEITALLNEKTIYKNYERKY